MLGKLIRKMQKEEVISALGVRIVWKRNIVRLGTYSLSLYIFLINMLICTELLFILQGVSVRDAK